MNTEQTDKQPKAPKRGWVFYDGQCGMCIWLANHLRVIVERRGFVLAALQEPWIAKQLNLQRNAPPTEMTVLTPDYKIYGGADALVYLSRFVWWAYSFYILSKLPGMMKIFHAGYRWIAVRRHCISGACRLNHNVLHNDERKPLL